MSLFSPVSLPFVTPTFPSLGIHEVFFDLLLEEKKPVKRTYQKVQEEEEEEDDDYRCHGSPHVIDASGPQLVGDDTNNNLHMTDFSSSCFGTTLHSSCLFSLATSPSLYLPPSLPLPHTPSPPPPPPTPATPTRTSLSATHPRP